MKKIIASTLDSIADRIQAAGLIHLAETLDTVTNLIEEPPEVETEIYKEKYDQVRNWIMALNQSVLSGTSVQKLYRLVNSKVLSKQDLLNSPEWHAFHAALQKIDASTGAVIPDRFFSRRPKHKYYWSDLTMIPDVLDIKLTASKPGEDRKLDQESYAKQHAVKHHSDAYQKADALFKHANIILDRRLQLVDDLIRDLRTH